MTTKKSGAKCWRAAKRKTSHTYILCTYDKVGTFFHGEMEHFPLVWNIFPSRDGTLHFSVRYGTFFGAIPYGTFFGAIWNIFRCDGTCDFSVVVCPSHDFSFFSVVVAFCLRSCCLSVARFFLLPPSSPSVFIVTRPFFRFRSDFFSVLIRRFFGFSLTFSRF